MVAARRYVHGPAVVRSSSKDRRCECIVVVTGDSQSHPLRSSADLQRVLTDVDPGLSAARIRRRDQVVDARETHPLRSHDIGDARRRVTGVSLEATNSGAKLRKVFQCAGRAPGRVRHGRCVAALSERNREILARNGAPGRTRACDPRLRRPNVDRSQGFIYAGFKGRVSATTLDVESSSRCRSEIDRSSCQAVTG